MVGTLPDMKTAPCERCEPEQLRPALFPLKAVKMSIHI